MFGVPFHRLIVYLPIVLSVAALVCDAWAVSSDEGRYHQTGSRLSKWAAVTAVAAAATGFSLAGASGVGSSGGVTGHAAFGSGAAVVITALAFVRYTGENRVDLPEEAYTNLWLAVQITATILIVVTAIIGFRM